MVGNCDKQILSWYYDFNEGECKQINYSGCNGNLNRFESLDACQYTCQGLNTAKDQFKALKQQVCEAPKLTGACYLKLQRWYFNKSTGMCQQFTYSGEFIKF